MLVAIAGNRIVGHLQLIEAAGADASEIKNMAIVSAQRRCGIGRTLIQAAIDLTCARDRSTFVVATASADAGNLRVYQCVGFRMRSVKRDAFSPATGYATQTLIDGVELRDRVWLDLDLDNEMR